MSGWPHLLISRYSADTIHGNIMEVTYEGEAHHPDFQHLLVPESPLPPPKPLGARFERDATLAKSDPSQSDKYDGFTNFSHDIKPFIDFGFSRHEDEDISYDDNDYDYDYDYDYDTIIQALFPSPRRQRSLESLLDGPLFREYF